MIKNITRRQFLVQSSCLGAAVAIPIVRSETGVSPIPELKAAGSPAAIGIAHGRRFSVQVKHNVAFYLDYLSHATGCDKQRILTLANGFNSVIRDHCPALLEEMIGIARGANCQLDEILAVNARSDLLVLGRRKAVKTGRPQQTVPGCTALALEERVGGKTLLALGQNWDWKRALRKNTIILRLKPDAGPAIVTFTEAGMVGKIGFNSRRLGVCLNFLRHPSDNPKANPGVPVHCLLRAVLGCDNLADAMALVSRVPRCASANFLMAQYADQNASAWDLEWTPSATGRVPMRCGILVHTNHFKEKHLSQHVHAGNSFQRDARAEQMARALRDVTRDPAERMKTILAADDEKPVPLSRGMTQAGIVMDLGRNRLFVCAGPPRGNNWVRRPGV